MAVGFQVNGFLIISAGVGRTGTFIAIDRLLQELQAGASSISVFDTVMEMRRRRPFMVQNVEQYIYIHLCIVQAIREFYKSGNFPGEIGCFLKSFIFLVNYLDASPTILNQAFYSYMMNSQQGVEV